MADPALSATVWDALRQLAFEDGERVAVLSALAHAKESASHDERLDAARVRVAAAQHAAAQAAAQRRALEARIEDGNLRAKKTEDRLASGKLQHEREISAAQTELDTLKAAVAQDEEAWLRVSGEEDAAKAALPSVAEDLASEERAASVRQSAALAEVKEIEGRLATIDALRREAASKLPPDVRDRYRALFPRTGGRPFAEAIAGQCSYCHSMVPAAAVQMLRAHTGVPSCSHCSRLLLAP